MTRWYVIAKIGTEYKEGAFEMGSNLTYQDEWREDLTGGKKAVVATEFKCHLYDDLIIRLEDIFDDSL